MAWNSINCLHRFFFACFIATWVVSAQLVLPVPNGQYAVTHNTLKLVDESRVDQYDPNHGKRNVMISLFYPVDRASCEQHCPIAYMPPKTAAVFDTLLAVTAYGKPNSTFDGTFESIQLQVCCETSPDVVTDIKNTPLVLFSHGLGASRLLNNAFAQTLASAGYAVVTMDHTFEAAIVEYPDGTFTPGLNQSYLNASIPGRLEELLEPRLEDARFLLSQLGRKDVVEKLVPDASSGFNTRRAAFYGQSFGGATAIQFLMRNATIAGALDLDGQVPGSLSDTKKPALFFGRSDPSPHNRTNDPTLESTWEHLRGWRRALGLENSEHLAFSDASLILKLAKLPLPDEVIKAIIGRLDGERSFDIIATYVKAFMDFVLKGEESELLNGPSEEYPEIVVE